MKTIKFLSVEADRAFLALGYFTNDIRICLNDHSFDALIVLRQYYSKQTWFVLGYVNPDKS